MAFKFLHAADLHLGSPFTGLALKDETVAKRFAAASRDSFSQLVTRAIEEQVAFAVIAGDVYDGEWKDTSIGLFFNREVARLQRSRIPLYLLKGNHDAESVVTKAISLPDTVFQFPTTAVKTFRLDDLKVALHGRGFPDRAVPENFALSYPDPVAGWFNIGVLHTSCDGRPGHANYAPCSVADLRSRGYQYWALGHIHEYEQLSDDPWIVFPGNLQSRSVRECGPKGAVIVDVADDGVKAVRRLIVDHARWATVVVDVTGIDQETALIQKIEDTIRPAADATQGRLLALRVSLQGKTQLHRRLNADSRRYMDEAQAAAHRCHEDVWLERLRVETEEMSTPAPQDAAIASLDLGAMLRDIKLDPAFRNNASELIASVTGKLPGGIVTGEASLSEDLEKILTKATALVLGRALRGQEQ
jgi:DNA repair exonuclease SbcCD nuclease subunit